MPQKGWDNVSQFQSQFQSLFLAVDVTDGRTTQAVVMDPQGDTEQSVALLFDRLKADGYTPIKGSERMVRRPGFKVSRNPRTFGDLLRPAIFRRRPHAIPGAR